MAERLAQIRKRAVAAHQAGEMAEAAGLYAAYLAHRPRDGTAWSNLGALHRTQGRHLTALKAQNIAYAIAPDDLGVRNNLANILSDIGQYDRSIALRRDILRQKPDQVTHKAMIGRCLRGKGDYAAAIKHLNMATQQHPDDAELRLQLAFAQLGAGDYAAGLQNYKARWQTGERGPRDLPFPEWQGEPLKDKTIAVLPEQGFGDAVLFARFLSVLSGRGARVVMVVKLPLRRLLDGISGIDDMMSDNTSQIQADYWVNMMDLATLWFADHQQVPPPATLNVPKPAILRAKAIAAPHADKFKVGVVWTGSTTYTGNAFRSFTHREFLPLTEIPGVQLFSLYKGPALQGYYADGTDAFILDAGASEADFADCAAMMQGMDLVITSDTATSHIAGSLGVPVWTVLHWDAFWVFGHRGETTDWYPCMKLFRQDVPLDWNGVMAEVNMALRSLVRGKT